MMIDAREIDRGFLRGEFTTRSCAETRALAKSFAPLVSSLIQNSIVGKVRLGLTGASYSGKTPFAESLIEGFFPGYLAESYLDHASHFYIGAQKPHLIHYDKAGIDMYHFDKLDRAENHPDLLDYGQHHAACSNADIHVVEWPERDTDESYDFIWDIKQHVQAFSDPKEPSERRISFYCTDYVASLPEFKLVA
jgi:tRNA A37 threonylcarbamoyladenosine biosynthesis protein TsaE